jgi:protein-S-isoprenylcysteine O-methyltransferase Ste14
MAEPSSVDQKHGCFARLGHPRKRSLGVAIPSALTKFSYGVLFVVILPVLLIAWAHATSTIITAPAIHSLPSGLALVALGVLVILSGWIALWRAGGGLPMNIAPPPRFVSSGVYAVLPHPIYTGFCLTCLGVAVATGSASGIWLVTPCVILGCFALVLGYESHDLANRFGAARQAVRFLPANSANSPNLQDRLACYFFLFLPWLVLYRAFIALGLPAHAVATSLPFERRLPVLQGTEFLYAGAYLYVLAAPLLATTQKSLRQLCLRGFVSMATAFPLFWVLPFVAETRHFSVSTFAGLLLMTERRLDSPNAAFPSYHVVWALLVLPIYESHFPRWRWLWRCATAAVAVSCLTTGMHALLDVVAGVLIGVLSLRCAQLWQVLRCGSEWMANSWREWRPGPVRIINHGLYAGLAGFVVLALAGLFAGRGSETSLLVVACVALVSSGLWAQYVEGSSRLLRPFGYFGGFFGVALGALVVMFFGQRFWLTVAAIGIGAPWMQAIGRLRCLVQGCCHGGPASSEIGIRYHHERSRVTKLSALRGVPLHPTPLYSILWNVYIGLAIAHLWVIHEPAHFLVGLYCILMGLGRFVEEAYRGEPQTPILLGLRLYQWIALTTVVGGMLITALGRSSPAPTPHFSNAIWWPALVFGLLAGFALGVDFPVVNRRFARLT